MLCPSRLNSQLEFRRYLCKFSLKYHRLSEVCNAIKVSLGTKKDFFTILFNRKKKTVSWYDLDSFMIMRSYHFFRLIQLDTFHAFLYKTENFKVSP